jgi:RluA family pseudouridine synthase
LESRLLLVTPELLVLDKPAGLPIAARQGEDLARHLPALRMGKKRDPQPAHRLDADTAGLLVLGRTAPMLAALNALFAERRVRKTYWAVVRGAPGADGGVIDAPLLKTSTREAGWRMGVDAKGDPARTHWRVLGRAPGLAWLELRPETGRTHQLRVHCAHLGCPILGDAMYGPKGNWGEPGGLHLLARALHLPLDPPLDLEAPVPPHMQAALARCGRSADPQV